MEIHIKIIGVVCMLLGLSHIFFPSLFHWKQELKSLSLINKQLMEVHTFFIALVVVLIGALCFNASHDLLHTTLGNKLCIGLTLFWMMRLGVQLFVFSKQLWEGKAKETSIHILLILLWTYFSAVYGVVAFM